MSQEDKRKKYDYLLACCPICKNEDYEARLIVECEHCGHGYEYDNKCDECGMIWVDFDYDALCSCMSQHYGVDGES